MTVLPSPKEGYWKEVDSLLHKFIAGSRTEKIKRMTLIGNYKQGGFKMTDIREQNKAIKTSWLKRFINNAGMWREFVMEQIPHVDYRYLLRCNLKFEDMPFSMTTGTIWDEIWTVWCELNYVEYITTVEDVLNQTLWYNSNIRIGNKPAFFKKWASHGIMWLKDIIDEDTMKMKSKQQLEQDFELSIPFTEHYGLLLAIPKEWKKMIKEQNPETLGDYEDYKLIDKIDDCDKPSKMIYETLIKKKFIAPTEKVAKWNLDLNIQECQLTYLKQLEAGRTCTINNKLRSFNYNFFMRNVPYNSRLFKMKIKDNNN